MAHLWGFKISGPAYYNKSDCEPGKNTLLMSDTEIARIRMSPAV